MQCIIIKATTFPNVLYDITIIQLILLDMYLLANTGRGKAAKAQPALEKPSDSEEEEGAAAGLSIKGVLQHMVQGMTSQDGDR